MLKRTERISFRISSVLSKVEPEPGAGPSHQLRPESTGSGRFRLHNTGKKRTMRGQTENKPARLQSLYVFGSQRAV